MQYSTLKPKVDAKFLNRLEAREEKNCLIVNSIEKKNVVG